MAKYPPELKANEDLIPLADFLKSYNQNMPPQFPRASASLLQKFKETYPMLFKHGDLWSLDRHRKKVIEWLPLNGGIKNQ